MKKLILVGILAFAVGATISPVAGMALSSTRNLILGMAPEEAILVLADKIDEESNRNDEQEQAIEELNSVNQEQIEQIEEINQDNDYYKKQECLAENTKLQEEMNRAKSTLSGDQDDLKEAESGKYKKDCLKTQKDEEICDRNSKINLKSRKADVQEDMDWLNDIEQKIANLKNRCGDYL